MSKVYLYARVSTNEQGESRNGLEAQIEGGQAIARRLGFDSLEIVEEVQSGAKITNRPLLKETLGLLKADKGSVLVVTKLDRLSRSVRDLCTLLEQSEREGWSLVIGDLGVDTTTPSGRLQAHMLASVAEFQRRRIAEATKEGLASVKSRGVKLGRPVQISSEVVEQVVAMRYESRLTFREIANRLNENGVPSKGAKGWTSGSVDWVLRSERGLALAG
jgi:DNA invertase Pin-like site-specific DNA recombinase